ncbi:type III-A CRISPR-associated RAMP protein Csm5 [Nitrosomonas ureae]|uniref:CRISPR system Cms protein Csm5 n=1 Tax=Nitrosomonas ureae TaxID=44577 RepID=A0A2T5IUE6_9PROT|nr:type III-A CRISPR-associated RAMP protein Csm5 [Nitrosomonas ureae]PTQ87502.1 CRISPR type III-A-associated RAMP protein Csm5 [Nitrosomonas ureae]PXX17114.1 CRISPR type III-A-associated RAMP protein Csm5 [Nitrosomonas ureae]
MKGINHTVKLGLEIITPTQSGSGTELFKELDYIERNQMAFIVDQQASFQTIASGNLALDAQLLAGNRLSDWVNAAGQDLGYRLPWLTSTSKVPDKFREQLKDAMNRPYLPGSAIKGAIRTALIAEWLRCTARNEAINKSIAGLLPKSIPGKKLNPKFAADNLMAALIGKDAKQDIFRSFKVKDTLFANSELRLSDIRWLNEARWRSMSQRKSFEGWQQADGIHAEVLQPGALGLLVLQWDGFLLSNVNKWQQDGTVSAIAPKDFDDLRQRLNQHAEYRLKREIEFYKQQGKPAPERECQRILNMFQAEEHSAYMQMSWGSGWRGMTGDWASDEQVKTFRELFNLGRTGKPFPKTRRLAVSGEPKLPMGWVRLLPYELVADKLEKQQTRQQANSAHSAWVNQKLAQIAQQNRSPEKEALRGKALAEAWQALPDGEEKQAALADIKARWQTEGWWEQPNGKSAKQAKTIYEQD